MHVRATWLIMLCLALAAVPATGQVLYEDGPVNGTTDAWTINFGYIVSNTFTLTGSATVGGFDIYTWEYPGDKALTVDWSVTSGEFGGTTYGSGTASLSDQFLSENQYGFNIDKLTASNLNLNLGAGTYWLNLQNASVPSGDPVYWDENSGPSQASQSAVGSIPSEAFDILGECISGNGRNCGPPTPEPGSIILFGSGVLGVVGVLRRKML